MLGQFLGLGLIRDLPQGRTENGLNLALVPANRRASGIMDRQLTGGIEKPTAAETVVVGASGVIQVGVEDRQDALGWCRGLGSAQPVQIHPFLVAHIDVGRHQCRLVGEIVVEAHLGHSGLRDDGVDAGCSDFVR